MLLTDINNLPEYVFTGKKFLRRKDITEAIRAHIAVTVRSGDTLDRGTYLDPEIGGHLTYFF